MLVWLMAIVRHRAIESLRQRRRRALETSPDSLEPELQNRLVLATSLVAGENYVADSDQSRPGDHVDFGAVSISGTDFSRLISEIRQRVQGQEGTARKPGQPAAGADAVFQPGTLGDDVITRQGKVDGIGAALHDLVRLLQFFS